MKIVIKSASNVPIEEAHGGSGSRKLYVGERESPSEKIQGFTRGWLPAGKSFDWHKHEGVEELMYVLNGQGLVADEDGEYAYDPETLCIFPAGVMHKIFNNSDQEHQFIFIRVYVDV